VQCARRKFMLVRLLCALSLLLLPTHAEMRARGVIFAAEHLNLSGRACTIEFSRTRFSFIRLIGFGAAVKLIFSHTLHGVSRGVRNDPLMDGHSLVNE
jgi:hypothetical protein